jgi:nitrate/TMAO reductase-like tetraheme cytochrome c subunit
MTPAKKGWVRITLAACLMVFVGVALVGVTNSAVNYTSSDKFCGKFCHSMTWASDAYKRGPHYGNAVGVRASCGDCHIPYDASHATAGEYIVLLGFKINRGANDFYHEWKRTIATKEEWEKRMPGLRAEYEAYLTKHNYVTCRGCHQLDAFKGKNSTMKMLIHADVVKSDAVDCLRCHSNIGHVYEIQSTREGGWYTTEQADSGGKIFEKSCASCHGAKLEGGGGPSLVGASWHQLFGGAKLLRVWGQVKGPMAQMAGVKLSERESLDVVAFLLSKNGLPAGSKPLADTRELSALIPSK